MANAAEPSRQGSPRGSWLRYEAIPLALVLIGVALRLQQYLANYSLRLDEAMLALNISSRSFAGLLRPLDYMQGAPVGFLLLQKAAVNWLGDNEYGLRLVPLLAGLASVPLFYLLARRWLSRTACLIALALFAISTELVRFAREDKQYSLDVLVVIGLYMGVATKPQGASLLRGLLAGLLGAVALWLSHPAGFILAALALVQIWQALAAKTPRVLGYYAVSWAMWAASFVVLYRVSLANLGDNSGLVKFWQDAFMPLPPRSVEDAVWFIRKIFEVLGNPGGFQYAGVAAVPLLVGGLAVWRSNRPRLGLLLVPVGLVAAASALHKYPFSDRLILFLVPALLLLVGAGTAYLYERVGPRSAGAVVLICLVLVPYALRVGTYLREPVMVCDVRPALEHYAQHRQPGDALYVYRFAFAAVKYYGPKLGISDRELIWGAESSHPDTFSRILELDKVRGKGRVWFLFADEIPNWLGVNDEKYFVHYLDRNGSRLATEREAGAAIYLYDLGGRQSLNLQP